MRKNAFLIVDPQRGFMPCYEGVRLNVDGFGELPVPGGELIIEPLNYLISGFVARGDKIATTQDEHPEDTAHCN